MRTVGIVSLLTLTACQVDHTSEYTPPEAQYGEIDFSWQIGTSGCTTAGVETVEVDLGDESALFDCVSGGGSMTVPAGLYDVEMTGFDSVGVARYSGSYEDVQVSGDDFATVPTVVLGALPATMTVTWFFENGRLCGSNDVSELDIIVFDNDFILEVFTTECDDGIEQVGPVLSGSYTIQIVGRDSLGTAAFIGDSDTDLEKGDDTAVEIELLEI